MAGELRCEGVTQEAFSSAYVAEMSQDGGPWTTLSGEMYGGYGPGYYKFWFDWTSAVAGPHHIKFRATDPAGNVSSEYVANFTAVGPRQQLLLR